MTDDQTEARGWAALLAMQARSRRIADRQARAAITRPIRTTRQEPQWRPADRTAPAAPFL